MIKSWSELPVKDWLEIGRIGEMTASDDEKNMMIGALLAGIPYKEFLLMPLKEVREVMDNTEFMLHPPVPEKARRKYVVNGRTYKLFKDSSEMTVAQYIDFQQMHREGFEKMPAELLSIFLIPDGHSYNDGYDKEEQIEDMKQISVAEALGICDFFTGRCLKSIKQMRIRLKVAEKLLRVPEEQKEQMKALTLELTLALEQLEGLFGLKLSRR